MKYKGIILVFFSTLIASSGQLFLKIGSSNLSLNLKNILLNWPFLIGVIFYILAALILIIALKYGELSVLYPIYALNFVWVSLLALIVIGEQVSLIKGLGIFVIIFGVIFISKSNNKEVLNA